MPKRRKRTTAPAITPAPPEEGVHLYPGDNLLAAINGVPNQTFRIHAPENGAAYTYLLASALKPGAGSTLIGDPATRGPLGQIYAPTQIRGSAATVIDLNNTDGVTLSCMDLSGGVGLFPSGRVISQGTNGFINLCKIRDSETQGIGNWQGRLEDCELTGNTTTPQSGVSAAFKSTRTGLTVRRTYIHRNGGHGLWVDCDAGSLLVEDCRIELNQRTGFFYEISRGQATVQRTYIGQNNQGNTAGYGGAIATSSKNLLLDGCTFDSNVGQNLKIWEDRRFQNGASGCASGYYLENIRVENCTRLGTEPIRLIFSGGSAIQVSRDGSYVNPHASAPVGATVGFAGNVY